MVDVKDVALWFLHKDTMTHKKLQKLCYYSQAWYCALYDGSPLFAERVEAWVHGPVVPALYAIYSGYGWQNIPKEETAIEFEEDVQNLLEAVYATYGEYSGDQLERITHAELPWQQARAGIDATRPSHAEIKISDMRSYYKERYEQAQGE